MSSSRCYCGSCRQYGDWNKQWWEFKHGSKYRPNKSGGPSVVYICPTCIRMLSRDAERDMRFSHMTDDKSWLSECDVFWRLEVAHVIKKIERDHDAWYAPRQHNLVRRRPIDVEAQECVVGVPAKRRMLSQLSEDVPAPPPPPYLFGGDGDVPVPF